MERDVLLLDRDSKILIKVINNTGDTKIRKLINHTLGTCDFFYETYYF